MHDTDVILNIWYYKYNAHILEHATDPATIFIPCTQCTPDTCSHIYQK